MAREKTMISNSNIERLFRICRMRAIIGLGNNKTAYIPHLCLNIVEKSTFIGVGGNPAIFVNNITYRILKKFHPLWKPNITVVLKRSFLESKKPMDIVGVIVHEAGHAFNVYSGIKNTEKNAYIFEIDVLLCMYKKGLLSEMFDITKTDLSPYFNDRMSFYIMDADKKGYLFTPVKSINDCFNLTKPTHPKPSKSPEKSPGLEEKAS